MHNGLFSARFLVQRFAIRFVEGQRASMFKLSSESIAAVRPHQHQRSEQKEASRLELTTRGQSKPTAFCAGTVFGDAQ
jgi:hypothetical protein